MNGRLGLQIKDTAEKLKKPQRWEQTALNVERRKKLEKDYASLLEQEEVYWRQRSRAVWLRDDD